MSLARFKEFRRMPIVPRLHSLIESGAMKEPKCWTAMKRYQPHQYQVETMEDIVFPQDRLQLIYERRNPNSLKEPVDTDGPLVTAVQFANDQWTLMKQGAGEAEAYRQVKKELKQRKYMEKKERKEAVMGDAPQAESNGKTLRPFFDIWAEQQMAATSSNDACSEGNEGNAGNEGASRGVGEVPLEAQLEQVREAYMELLKEEKEVIETVAAEYVECEAAGLLVRQQPAKKWQKHSPNYKGNKNKQNQHNR